MLSRNTPRVPTQGWIGLDWARAYARPCEASRVQETGSSKIIETLLPTYRSNNSSKPSQSGKRLKNWKLSLGDCSAAHPNRLAADIFGNGRRRQHVIFVVLHELKKTKPFALAALCFRQFWCRIWDETL